MKITLCGSAKFEKEFKEANKALSLAGHIVYSLAIYPSDMGGNKDWYSEEQKVILDLTHIAKIDNSDAIFVLDYKGYIGESTRREIAYAKMQHKMIYYLSVIDLNEIYQLEDPNYYYDLQKHSNKD